MIIKCECNKTEYHELIKQLKDEGLNYRATVQTTLDETYEGDLLNAEYLKTTQYFVVFWYSGKLI